jgi:HSP20 family molecular chaperone IbpA
MSDHATMSQATMSQATATKEPEQQTSDTERTRAGTFYRPPVDILETKDELLLRADVPGAKRDEININFEDGQLSVHAPVAKRYNESTHFLMSEYGVGDFYRSFRVSEHVDASKITAEYADGVLTVHLPKTEAVKPRKIEVRSN